MKNITTALASALFLLLFGLGCGGVNPFSGGSSGSSSSDNRTMSDKAVDTTVGKSKIGVPECDEVMDLIDAELNNPDDDFVTKAIKATVLNRIKDGLRDSIEKNKADTTEMAKTCKEFKTQFEKFKAEQQQKSN